MGSVGGQGCSTPEGAKWLCGAACARELRLQLRSWQAMDIESEGAASNMEADANADALDSTAAADLEVTSLTRFTQQPPALPSSMQKGLPPLVSGGGCPFRQGEIADERRPPSPTGPPTPPASVGTTAAVQPPPAHPMPRLSPPGAPPGASSPVDVRPAPPRQPVEIPPSTSPHQQPALPRQPNPPPHQPAVMQSAQRQPAHNPPPAQQSLTPSADQIAAFQAAYLKALASQKALFSQTMQSRAPAPANNSRAQGVVTHPQQPSRPPPAPIKEERVDRNAPPGILGGRGRAAPSASGARPSEPSPHPRGNGEVARPDVWGTPPASAGRGYAAHEGLNNMQAQSEALAPPLGGGGEGDGSTMGDEDDEGVDGRVLATSCAHGPLVTHPAMTQVSGMMASVFPSSNESWLYVTVAGEFGTPWAMGITATGVG